MDPAEIRRRVLKAIREGRIPPGGPSELAAYDLLDDVPEGYLENWSKESVERIREQVRNSRCRCAREPEFVTADQRCGRCFGRREEP